MTIRNVRLGFATNSSSSHSVVFNPAGVGLASVSERTIPSQFEFGWEPFELTTAGEKLGYLAVAVLHELHRQGFSSWMADVVLCNLFAGTGIENHLAKLKQGYIDHQSVFALGAVNPADYERNVRQCIEIFSDPRITVYGGNDNDGSGYEPRSGERELYLSDVKVRKDGDAIVLYNRTTGAKIRYSSSPYEKSSIPELVDVKVTDRCPFGCEFCYQNSTPSGKAESVFSLVFSVLGKIGVFEVAIGGGEPTHMRDFPAVIRSAHAAGLTPNFTTFSTSWLLDPDKVEAAKLCRGIGVSVHSWQDFKDKIEVMKEALPAQRIVAQHVFGTAEKTETWRILSEAKNSGVPVLLLGLKKTGRGKGYESKITEYFFDRYRTPACLPELSVDTAFIVNHPDIIAQMGSNNVLLSPREGAFSMYIDAVGGKLGPSSYCPDEQLVDLPKMWADDAGEKLLEAFATF